MVIVSSDLSFTGEFYLQNNIISGSIPTELGLLENLSKCFYVSTCVASPYLFSDLLGLERCYGRCIDRNLGT